MPDGEGSRTVRVAWAGRGYDVVIGQGLLASLGARLARQGCVRAAIVTDETVARLYGAAARASLDAAGIEAAMVTVPAGEASKSWRELERVCGALIDAKLERRDLVVALGGGVVGDLAGLAAGLVKRGLDYVQVPTTLLAQVDSSVGGKTAIDVAQGKNLVGLFHQPSLVLADVATLSTLPVRERRAGYAEVLKYGLIDDPAFFDWAAAAAPEAIAGAPEALEEAVARSVAAKARVVAADEREAGPRALLNLGHTFAHGLEAIAGFDGALLHGEAVGCGIAMAFRYAAREGFCAATDAARAADALARAGLVTDPRRLPGGPFASEAMLAAMAHDKKAEHGRLTLILARGVGQAFVHKNTDAQRLRAFLEEELGSSL